MQISASIWYNYTKFWGYPNQLELAEQFFRLSECCGSLTETQKIYSVLVLDKQVAANNYVDILINKYNQAIL